MGLVWSNFSGGKIVFELIVWNEVQVEHTGDLDHLLINLYSCVSGEGSNILQKPRKAASEELW